MVAASTLLIGGGALLALLAASGSGGKSAKAEESTSNLLVPEVLARLQSRKIRGNGVYDAGSGLILYTLTADGGGPSGIEAVLAQIRSGGWVFADMSIIGQHDYVLGMGPAGAAPPPPWKRLATRADLATLERHGSQVRPPPGGSASPGTAASPVPGAPEETGIPDVDQAMRSPDATPAQLWAIADELEKQGMKRESDIVRRKADHLYVSLRARHTKLGGTPFLVEEGHIPVIVAKHYGGTLNQLKAANRGKDIVSPNKDWRVGNTILLPLTWDAERKVPPAPLKVAPKAAQKAAAKAPEATSAQPSTVSSNQQLPYNPAGHGPVTTAIYNAGADSREATDPGEAIS